MGSYRCSPYNFDPVFDPASDFVAAGAWSNESACDILNSGKNGKAMETQNNN